MNFWTSKSSPTTALNQSTATSPSPTQSTSSNQPIVPIVQSASQSVPIVSSPTPLPSSSPSSNRSTAQSGAQSSLNHIFELLENVGKNDQGIIERKIQLQKLENAIDEKEEYVRQLEDFDYRVKMKMKKLVNSFTNRRLCTEPRTRSEDGFESGMPCGISGKLRDVGELEHRVVCAHHSSIIRRRLRNGRRKEESTDSEEDDTQKAQKSRKKYNHQPIDPY